MMFELLGKIKEGCKGEAIEKVNVVCVGIENIGSLRKMLQCAWWGSEIDAKVCLVFFKR